MLETRRSSEETTTDAMRLAGEAELRPCVLVAEDDDPLRQAITAALEEDGYEVLEASDGLAVLDRIGEAVARHGGGKQAVSLIVSDIRMPGLDGLDVLTALRSASWGTPVILMTAFASPEMRREALRLGAITVLSKPFGLEDLRTVVRRAVPPDGASAGSALLLRPPPPRSPDRASPARRSGSTGR